MAYVKLDEIEAREVVPGYTARFVHSERMTLAYWTIEAGAALPEHSHPHEQITNLIAGQFEFTLEGETRLLEPGEVVVIPAGAIHSGKAVTECTIIDAFSPVREDYQ